MNLAIANRQRTKKINLRLLKQITAKALLDELKIPDAALEINLLGAEEMAALNETFLKHEGSTDVITFDYAGKTPGKTRRNNFKRRDFHLCGRRYFAGKAIQDHLAVGNCPLHCAWHLASVGT